MTKLTKIELEQRLNAALTENEALRAEVSRLHVQMQAVTSVASAVNTLNGPTARAVAMAAAREIAMKTRSVVKVETLREDSPRDEEGLRARAIRDDISHVC